MNTGLLATIFFCFQFAPSQLTQLPDTQERVLKYPTKIAIPENLPSVMLYGDPLVVVLPQVEYLRGHYVGWQFCVKSFYYEGKMGLLSCIGAFHQRRARPGMYRDRYENDGRKAGLVDCRLQIKRHLKTLSVSEVQSMCKDSYFSLDWSGLKPDDLAKSKLRFERRERSKEETAVLDVLNNVLADPFVFDEFDIDTADPRWKTIRSKFSDLRIEEIGNGMCVYGAASRVKELREMLSK